MKVVLAATLLIGAAACNGGVFDDDDLCGMSLEVTGAIDDTVDPDADVRCSTFARFGLGIYVSFAVPQHSIVSVSFRNDTIMTGQLGRDQPAAVTITGQDDSSWGDEDCLLDVEESDAVGGDRTTFRIVGAVACPEPLVYSIPGVNNPATLESFDFVATVEWEPFPF